jgi:RNA polymerase-interacting CarD/CdnL/TRCF family regulator
MLTETQQTRIARRCTEAVIKAVDAFPAYLANSEPEQAAAIVADLIKSDTNRPSPVEPKESLERILAEIARDGQQLAP